MRRDRLTQRVLEQYRNEALNEHYENSRKYFINVLSLAVFVGFIALFIALQNHYSFYINYAKYDLARYENMIDESVVEGYESVKGEGALPKWEQYKKIVRKTRKVISRAEKADEHYRTIYHGKIHHQVLFVCTVRK